MALAGLLQDSEPEVWGPEGQLPQPADADELQKQMRLFMLTANPANPRAHAAQPFCSCTCLKLAQLTPAACEHDTSQGAVWPTVLQ